MIRIFVMAGLLGALVAPRGASAEEQAAQPAPGPEARWAVGAGVFGGVGGTYVLLGPLDAAVGFDNAQVAVERRVAAHTWLGLGLQGGYARLGDAGWFGGPSLSTETQEAVAVAARLRQVLNPGEAVELAPYGQLGLGAIHSSFDTPAQGAVPAGTTTADRGSASLGAGLTAEHRLTQQLYLRLQLQLLDVEYARTLSSQGGLGALPALLPSGSSVVAALVARPSLQLFMRF